VFAVTALVGTQQMQLHDKLYLLLKAAFSHGKQTSRQVVEASPKRRNNDAETEAIGRMQPNAFAVMSALLNDVTQAEANRMVQVLEVRFGLGDCRYKELSALSWKCLKRCNPLE